MVVALNCGIEYIYRNAGLEEGNPVSTGVIAQPQPLRYYRSDKLVQFTVKRRITQELLQYEMKETTKEELTLRLLMSYIYIYIYIYIYMEHLFLMFLDHTQRRTTVGKTPLDE